MQKRSSKKLLERFFFNGFLGIPHAKIISASFLHLRP